VLNISCYQEIVWSSNMLITRVYTGDDGQAHFEEIETDDFPNPESLLNVSGIRFRIQQPGAFSDWHQESQRNYIITLAGEGELGIGDGTLRRIRPGEVMLVEDLTGQGHTTRVTSSEPRITAQVPLKNQTPGT
jgi:quercetin dioxygenase-like cupin family protein